MNRLMVFSAIYLILACLGPVLGFYALRLYPKGAVNRIFFAATICLTLWALGLSVAVVAPDAQSAALWSRVAAAGHVSIYSLMLHFVLLLIGSRRLPDEKWLLIPLYLPAAVLMYALVLSPGVARLSGHYEFTAGGWFRSGAPTVYDTLFQAYALMMVLGGLGLLWRWGRGSDRPEIRKQAWVLTASFAAAFVLGPLADALNRTFFRLPVPPTTPIFFLIPVTGIFFCVNRYHFMKPPEAERGAHILNDRLHRMVFRIAAFGLILGGMALFLLEYFWWNTGNHALTILASVILVALGIALMAVERMGKGYERLEVMLIAASLTVTPILIINMAHLGGMTIWAFPLMLVVCSLVFNSNILLLASAVSLLFGQAYLWGVVPQVTVMVDARTYAGRGIVVLAILAAAYFVHQVYLIRLRDGAAQSGIQSLISAIAGSFSQADRDSAPERMRQLVDQLAEFFEASTALACAVEEDFVELTGIRIACAGRENPPQERMALCMERWEEYRQRLMESPAEAAAQLSDPGARLRAEPWLIIPVFMGLKPVAFLYVEASRRGMAWRDDQLAPLPFISRVLSGAMEKLSSEARIQFMAYYDALTQLPNRQLFHDRAEQAIHLARRNNTALAVLFLDLDYFKSINDTMGHEGGDILIQEISRELKKTLRKTDTIARFGGDEFVILLNNIADVTHISGVADKVMEIFQKPILIKAQEVFITASAGVSVFPVDGEDAETLIKHADIAMYTAKEKGKNQYAFCSDNMKERVEYRVNLANSLYRALERGELRVYYQPQIDLNSERITGLEALLRWFHPEMGVIPPSAFIPLAEQTGLINSIGAWVLETATRQVALWKAQGLGTLRIAVNLSVAQLRTPGLVARVAGILGRTGIDPAQVELEITESATMREPDYIIRVLSDLKALGVTISIDDFGTEYSSLNRLKILPVDKLKMDIQFVRGIDKSPKDQAIAVVIMNLAKNLNLKLVAEGVESSSQLNFLKQRMCDEVQGFYYFKPMPAEEIEKILRG